MEETKITETIPCEGGDVLGESDLQSAPSVAIAVKAKVQTEAWELRTDTCQLSMCMKSVTV